MGRTELIVPSNLFVPELRQVDPIPGLVEFCSQFIVVVIES